VFWIDQNSFGTTIRILYLSTIFLVRKSAYGSNIEIMLISYDDLIRQNFSLKIILDAFMKIEGSRFSWIPLK